MSGRDENPRGDSEFECQSCGRYPDFWYLLGYQHNGWRVYGVFRSIAEGARNGGIRISVISRDLDERHANLEFFKNPWWTWQIQCPLCKKTHGGMYTAHRLAREIIQDLLPTEFRNVFMREIL